MHRKGKSKNIKSLFRDWVYISVCHLTSCAKKRCVRGTRTTSSTLAFPKGATFLVANLKWKKLGLLLATSTHVELGSSLSLPEELYANNNSVAEYGII